MADRRKAVDTPRFGGLVSGGPAVVPVVAFWGCWVGAGSVSAMRFAGGEVLLVRHAWWQRLVEGHSVSAGGEGRVGDTRAAGAMPTLGGPAPTFIRWCGFWPLARRCEEGDCP